MAAVGSENEKFAKQPLETAIGDRRLSFIDLCHTHRNYRVDVPRHSFLAAPIGNTIALIFRYVIHQQKTKGDTFKPESRLVHLLLATIILPLGFLVYGWALAFHVQYIVPLIGTCAAGFSLMLSTIPAETYVVDVDEIHGASAIAAGATFRATAGAFLPLIGPPLYQSIGFGWGTTVLTLITAAFVPLLVPCWACW